MLSPVTEQLDVVETGGGRTLPLVPALCGVVIAVSWVAGCLAVVVPQ